MSARPPGQHETVAEYYHGTESGTIEASGIDDRVQVIRPETT